MRDTAREEQTHKRRSPLNPITDVQVLDDQLKLTYNNSVQT